MTITDVNDDDDDDDVDPLSESRDPHSGTLVGARALTLSAPAYQQRKSSCHSIYSHSYSKDIYCIRVATVQRTTSI